MNANGLNPEGDSLSFILQADEDIKLTRHGTGVRISLFCKHSGFVIAAGALPCTFK
jgi:hypothetical protein